MKLGCDEHEASKSAVSIMNFSIHRLCPETGFMLDIDKRISVRRSVTFCSDKDVVFRLSSRSRDTLARSSCKRLRSLWASFRAVSWADSVVVNFCDWSARERSNVACQLATVQPAPTRVARNAANQIRWFQFRVESKRCLSRRSEASTLLSSL